MIIYCYDMLNGKLINVFSKLSTIEQRFNVSKYKLRAILNGNGELGKYKLSKTNLGLKIEPIYKSISELVKCQNANKKPSRGRKLVYQYDLGYNLVKIWWSITELLDSGIVNRYALNNSIKNKQPANNFFWKFSEIDSTIQNTLIVEPIIVKKPENAPSGIDQYTLAGSYVNTFDKLTDIEKALGYSRHSIKNCLDGLQDSAYDYIWRRS